MLLNSPQTKSQILHEFLTICIMDGWTNEALLQAVKNCGIEEKFLPMIFENGCLDLAEFYVEEQNKKSAEKIGRIENFHQDKIRNKIKLSLYARFEVEDKIILQRLINFYFNPKNFTNFEKGPRPMIQGFKLCFKIADFIWKNINDQSTDFNFYTKRLTLAKIIFRSLLVFLKDESTDLSKTKHFIDEEIEKVMKFEKCKAKIKNILNNPKNFLKDLPFFRLIR